MNGEANFNGGRTTEVKGRKYTWWVNVTEGSDTHRKYKELAKRFPIEFLDEFDKGGKPVIGGFAVFVADDEREAFSQATKES